MELTWKAIPAVLLGAATAACGPEKVERAETGGPPVPVQIEVVRMAQVPVTVTAVGTTEPYAQATPGTRLMGRVGEVRVDEGDRVTKGSILVRIEDQVVVVAVGTAEVAARQKKDRRHPALPVHERGLDKALDRRTLGNDGAGPPPGPRTGTLRGRADLVHGPQVLTFNWHSSDC